MREPTLSALRAERHEALVLRLEALCAELRPLAARHPEAPVAPALRATAEGLLYDGLRFVPHARRTPFPVAAPDLGGLVVQLGQTLASLAEFEAQHSVWSPKYQAYVWRLGRGSELPVARLKPRLTQPPDTDRRDSARLRAGLLKQIQAKAEDYYEQGYRDGRDGKPPRDHAAKLRDRGRFW